MSAHLAVT